MATDPEELLRSIERTREELALTVDTIAGRLDPKLAAKRGVGKLRDGVDGAVDGVKQRFDRCDHNGYLPQLEMPATDAAEATDASAAAAPSALKNASSALKNVPKPVIGGGLAALVALAAILYAANRRQRH